MTSHREVRTYSILYNNFEQNAINSAVIGCGINVVGDKPLERFVFIGGAGSQLDTAVAEPDTLWITGKEPGKVIIEGYTFNDLVQEVRKLRADVEYYRSTLDYYKGLLDGSQEYAEALKKMN